MKKILIAAVSKNGVIGNAGAIPWHSKEDMRHFKETTIGNAVIMGRKSFESLKKPLKDRLNVVITRNGGILPQDENVIVVNDINAAFAECEKRKYEKAFVIGGGQIYSQTIDLADEMIISHMNVTIEGDTFFPEIDSSGWRKDSETNMGEFVVVYYKRINSVSDINA